MGLYMELIGQYFGWMAVFCAVGTAVFLIINKLWMYHGPEDDEVWEPDKEHFTLINMLKEKQEA
jgi:predicted MFS family arabinose efflux permease